MRVTTGKVNCVKFNRTYKVNFSVLVPRDFESKIDYKYVKIK